MWSFCFFMRFSTCFSLVAKRGFFIYQNFFSYERPLGAYFSGFMGRSSSNSRYLALWYEQHCSSIPFGTTFFDLGQSRSSLFGYFLLNMFPPHTSLESYTAAHILRLFKVLTYRGKRLSQRLPAHGQRTHSNSVVSSTKRRASTTIRQLCTGMR